MLSVPIATELNIINNSVLYNSTYDQGSGLYIDFTKPNLRYVGQVNIINNGTIYGRGGIGQTSSTDDRDIGKYAIKVLSDDSITREINITNNGDGVILGGGDGGNFITTHTVGYPFTATRNIGESSTSVEDIKNYPITINEPGGNAQYYNGTVVIDAEQPYVLTGENILNNRPDPDDTAVYKNIQYVSSSYENITITSNGGTQGFDTTKDIEVPNGFIIVNRIS